MNYLSQIIGLPVMDASGEKIGTVNDLGIATGEVFPRVTSLAFKYPGSPAFMVSWRKFVDYIEPDGVHLNAKAASDIRFSYLQPSEVLLARDLLNKQIVDTQGLKVVRVNDLKLSLSGKNQLRLLGAEVGIRGLLRAFSPKIERALIKIVGVFGKKLPEKLIAWNYMDLLDRDLSQVKLSVTHKRLNELHPADVADIIEQLDPKLRAKVFSQMETEHSADVMAEMEDEYQADVIDDLSEREASNLIAQMSPDDAADLINELSYEKAEKILRLMGIDEQRAIRSLLGYKDNTAGGIMTTDFVAIDENKTRYDAVELLRNLEEDHESVHYLYTITSEGVLTGVLSMRTLLIAQPEAVLKDLAYKEVIVASPEDDQEEVAIEISRYDLVAMPVVDENHVLLGIVTVDDALEVLEEEHQEDLAMASGTRSDSIAGEGVSHVTWFLRRELWFFVWIIATITMVVTNVPHALTMAIALPLILLIAEDTTSFATNHVIEHSNDDEDNTPSLSTLALKNGIVGVVVPLILWLIATAAHKVLDYETDLSNLGTISATVLAMAITMAISIWLTTPLIHIIKRREHTHKEISTVGLSVVVMIGAVGIFALISCGIYAVMGLI